MYISWFKIVYFASPKKAPAQLEPNIDIVFRMKKNVHGCKLQGSVLPWDLLQDTNAPHWDFTYSSGFSGLKGKAGLHQHWVHRSTYGRCHVWECMGFKLWHWLVLCCYVLCGCREHHSNVSASKWSLSGQPAPCNRTEEAAGCLTHLLLQNTAFVSWWMQEMPRKIFVTLV